MSALLAQAASAGSGAPRMMAPGGSGGPGASSAPGGGGNPAIAGLPHDIDGLIAYVVPLWVWVAGFFLLLLAGWVLWKLVQWMRKPRVKVVPPRDPWDVLKDRLGHLLPSAAFPRKEQREYFFQLSMILREAIELRTGIPATDRTTHELKHTVDRLPLKTSETEQVVRFLERADRIKFAGMRAQATDGDADRELVLRWVGQLRPTAVQAAASQYPGSTALQNQGGAS